MLEKDYSPEYVEQKGKEQQTRIFPVDHKSQEYYSKH